MFDLELDYLWIMPVNAFVDILTGLHVVLGEICSCCSYLLPTSTSRRCCAYGYDFETSNIHISKVGSGGG